MPRSSRHKSSKHSSRDVRDYSDTEKGSGLREKKGKEDGGISSSSRHLKDLNAGEKQKLDLKAVDVSKKSIGLGNAEYTDEFGGGVLSSRKRKEKVDDDRWTGGDDNHELEMSKSEIKVKEEVRGSGDSKRSSRRGVNYVSGFDIEEGKKSGSKGESKHHRSERKERGEKDAGYDRERKSSRSEKSEKLVDIVSVSDDMGSKGNRKQSGFGEEHGGKRKSDKVNCEKLIDIVSVSENTGSEGNRKQSGLGDERLGKRSAGNTDCNIHEEFKNPEPERDLDRRVRRKRDGSGDGDRHHAARDLGDRRLSSREETVKSGKYKDDGHKDDKNKDRFQEDIEKSGKYKDDGHTDDRGNRDGFQEDIDKDIWRRDEKQRDNRPSGDYNSAKFDDKYSRNDKKDLDLSYKKSMPHGGEYDRESDRDRDRDHDRDRGRDRDRDRGRLGHDREHDDRDHDGDRNRELDPDRSDRYRRELRGRVGVRDHDRGRNFYHEHDDYALHLDDKGSRYKDDRGRRRSPDGYDEYHSDKLQRVKTEVDKERSLSHKPNIDSVTSSSQHRASPSSRAFFGADKYRDGIQDETKYGDTLRDNTMPEAVERSPQYRSGEKRAKGDDNHIGEFTESPNARVSPAGLKDRSPSSTSFDRTRFSNRNTRRRSLDENDAERRITGSDDVRDMGVTEDRQSLPSKKFSGDEYPPSESPYYNNKNKSGQGNVSSHGPNPGPSVFRTRGDSPSFVGPFGDDNRGSRYRRSVDPNVARGPSVNAWNNGLPNWPSQLPNGYIPYAPGPPRPHHVGFPPIMPQFPPIFTVRPNLDMNHQGLPYHMADADRFQGLIPPMGWSNSMDGQLPTHFHAWEAGNTMYGHGHGHVAQRRDMNSDIWKQNGDMNMDVISESQKDGPIIKASTDDVSSAQGASKPNGESSCHDDQATSFKKDVSSGQSPMKDVLLTSAKGAADKTPESSGVDDTAQLLRAYLSELDISMDLANPELYNQYINLSIKGKSDYVENEEELEFVEEKAVVESEITNLTVDMKNFPAGKESIFQRAMNLYKTQSSERRGYVVPFQIEQTSVLKENIKQEDQTLMLPEPIAPSLTTMQGEDEKSVPLTSGEKLYDGPLLDSDFAFDSVEKSQMPVLDGEKMEEDTCLELIPGNVDLSVENNNQDPLIPIAGKDIAVDCKTDVGVSGSLNLCNDSVMGCEDMTSVSIELESNVLSRIHDAPGSTH